MIVDIDRTLDFFDFVVERHAMYERRQAGLPQSEWTTDMTLATRKFTNIFRWLDPGSQFVLTDLLPGTDEATALYRCTLYRYTNWIPTWFHLRTELGHYPGPDDNQQQILNIMRARRDAGGQMFSGAYMIIPQPGQKGDKLLQVINLVNRVMSNYEDFIGASTQIDRIHTLMSHYGVGKFLAQQILTDYMYQFGEPDTENEYVVEGPGSWKGAGVIAPGQKTVDVIHWAHEALVNMPACPTLVHPTTGLEKKPSLMDLQNCCCEFSKYVRGPRNSIYRPAHPGPLPNPVWPGAYLG